MNVVGFPPKSGTEARLVVHCLGRFQIEDSSGRTVNLRTRKARALLAAVACSCRAMARDELADLLWSDRRSAQSRASLRQTIFEIQHIDDEGLGVLDSEWDQVAVNPSAVVTDLELIRSASEEGDWARLVALLKNAGPGLLVDLDGLDPEFDDWLRHHRAQEPMKTLAMAVAAAERCRESARPRAANELVSELLRLDPVNEGTTRLAMRLAYEAGDRTALHRHFSGLSERLRDEFGAKPSAETVQLFDDLANGDDSARPTGHAMAKPAAEGADRQPSLRRRAILPMGALIVLLAVVFLAILVSSGRQDPSNGHPIIAVLPFEQQPPDDGFLAQGLWEQTRVALARNANLRVLGRTTTSAMAVQNLSADQYLDRFGVTHLLEGTVRRSGADLLVSASLTQTRDGTVVWQGLFRGRMGQPFALQDAIASGIEGKLRGRLAPGGGRSAEQIATSPEVYALFSEARTLMASRERDNIRRAQALLRQAVKIDPNYGPAWSMLGVTIHATGRIAITDSEARNESMMAVHRGLSLAPNFAPAHASLVLIEGDQSAAAEAPLRRALALDPSYSEAWNWLGNSLTSQYRLTEAAAAYERAIRLDPLYFSPAINLVSIAGETKDVATVGRVLRTVRKAGAEADQIVGLQAMQLYWQRDYSELLTLLQDQGLERGGKMNRKLWRNWFEALTAGGFYDDLHRITDCPDWYAPLVAGKALPPTAFEGKPVTAEEFWSSIYFSTPAARAMINRGKSANLVAMYRAGFRNSDEFLTLSERRNLLAELAPNVAVALRSQGHEEEAAYLLSAASLRLVEALKRYRSPDASGRLASIRAAQGDGVQALALLESAVRLGWLPDGRSQALDLAQEPAFHEMRGEPRFEAVRKSILAHIRREKAELGPLRV